MNIEKFTSNKSFNYNVSQKAISVFPLLSNLPSVDSGKIFDNIKKQQRRLWI